MALVFLATSKVRASQIRLWRSGFYLNISWLFFIVLSRHWRVLEGVCECMADGRGLHCTMLMMSLCDRQGCGPKTVAAEGFNVTGSCSNPSFVPSEGPGQTSQMEPERERMTESHSKVLDRSLNKLSQGYGLVLARFAYSAASVPQCVICVVMRKAFGLENDSPGGRERRSSEKPALYCLSDRLYLFTLEALRIIYSSDKFFFSVQSGECVFAWIARVICVLKPFFFF